MTFFSLSLSLKKTNHWNRKNALNHFCFLFFSNSEPRFMNIVHQDQWRKRKYAALFIELVCVCVWMFEYAYFPLPPCLSLPFQPLCYFMPLNSFNTHFSLQRINGFSSVSNNKKNEIIVYTIHSTTIHTAAALDAGAPKMKQWK